MTSPASTLRRFRPYSRLTGALCAGTATVALTLAPSCSSRSGGGAPASPAPAAAKAAPEILHFGEDKTSILAGETLHLTADFANGSGVIEPGHLAVTSGETIALTPTETTTYTLTVTDSDGHTKSETASATVTPLNQGLALLAGELNGTGNVDGVGALARFRYPMGVALDPSGNVFVADTGNAAIRKITPDGTVSTLAGTASILNPTRITADAAGNLYVVDSGSQISKIATDGSVTQVAAHDGDITTPHVFGGISDLAVNAAGTLFVVDGAENTIEQISNGMVTTLAGLRGVSGDVDGASDVATFEYPEGIALDAAGNLYVADAGNHAIRLVTASPTSPSGFAVKTLAGSPQNPGVVDGDVELATFGIISSLAVDPSGTIFVLDGSTIREIKDGLVTTMAGDPNYADTFDAVGPEAHFKLLSSLALDGEGNLYAADMADDVIRKITPEADTSTLAGKAERFISASIDGLGESANFYGPNGMATDALGNTYVADTHGNAIRKVSSTGYVTTLAGGLGFGYEDGQGAQALFNAPGAVAVDPSGNVYVTDNQNNLIRMITPQGKVSTLAGMRDKPGDSNGAFDAAQFNNMTAIAVDNAGYVYVTQPCAVRMLDPDNKTVTTLAGVADAYPNYVEGPANDARFAGLSGIAVDVKNGTVYVADQGNHRIRKITTSDGITSVALLAGSGEHGNQDGPSGSATFDHLNNLTLDSTGTYLYVTDGNLIRRISTADGSVTTEVGTRDKQGTMPGPLPASLYAPQGVAWDPTGPGHLLISVPDAILRVTF